MDPSPFMNAARRGGDPSCSLTANIVGLWFRGFVSATATKELYPWFEYRQMETANACIVLLGMLESHLMLFPVLGSSTLRIYRKTVALTRLPFPDQGAGCCFSLSAHFCQYIRKHMRRNVMLDRGRFPLRKHLPESGWMGYLARCWRLQSKPRLTISTFVTTRTSPKWQKVHPFVLFMEFRAWGFKCELSNLHSSCTNNNK